jgi:hypothetical protein
MTMMFVVLWIVTSCRLEIVRRFRGTYSLHDGRYPTHFVM